MLFDARLHKQHNRQQQQEKKNMADRHIEQRHANNFHGISTFEDTDLLSHTPTLLHKDFVEEVTSPTPLKFSLNEKFKHFHFHLCFLPWH